MKMLGAVVFALLVGLGLGYWWANRDGPNASSAETAVHVADEFRSAAIETVYVKTKDRQTAQAKRDTVRELVTIVSDSVLSVKLTPSALPSQVIVPPPVVDLIRADSALIAKWQAENESLSRVVSADSGSIAARDTLIVALKKGRCGTVCRAVIAAGGFALGALVRR